MAARGECSSLLSVKQFKEQFLEFLQPSEYDRRKNNVELQDLAKEMNVTMEIVTDLSEVCRYVWRKQQWIKTKGKNEMNEQSHLVYRYTDLFITMLCSSL